MLALIFLVIGGFLVGLSYPLGFEPLYFSPVLTLITCPLFTLIYVLTGGFLVRCYLKRIKSATPGSGEFHSIIKTYAKRVLFYRISLLLVYAVQIYLLHWHLIITYWLGLEDVIFVTLLLILAPFFVTYILSLIPFYRMDCFLRSSQWGIREFLVFQIRSYFMVIVLPVLFFLLFIDGIYRIEALQELIYVYPLSGWLMALGIMFAMFLSAPFVLKVLWGLKPLPQGELRERLIKLKDKAGVGLKDIMVWPIGRGKMANAMVIGLIPKWRYVIFTDTLLAMMTEEETETVFGHEIGHARQYHILFYLMFSVGYICLALVLEQVLKSYSSGNASWIQGNIFTFMMIYWIVLFGYISRRLEHQADLFGSLITNNFNAFANALRKIASLNAMSGSEKSVQHPSIEKRVRFLAAAQESPQFIKEFIKSLRKLVYVLTAIMAVGILGTFWVMYRQLEEMPKAKIEFTKLRMISEEAQKGKKLLDAKKYAEAAAIMEKVVAFYSGEPAYFILLGDAYFGRDGGLSPDALKSYKKAWSLKPIHPIYRMHLKEKLKLAPWTKEVESLFTPSP